MRVGVLALQGDVAEHRAALERCGTEVVEVKLPSDLEGLAGLILPGGESTTIGQLATDYGLIGPLLDAGRAGMALWGTCAGLILLAHECGQEPPLLDLLDVAVDRNAFGRQVDSFEIDLAVEGLGEEPFRAVFIRAPAITATGPGVDVLARLPDGPIVAVRQGRLLGTAFHPELSGDDRLHRRFLDLANGAS